MKVYKTKGGYYYKEYNSGKKIRISKEKFSQLKTPTINHTTKPVGKKPVGKKPVGKKSVSKKPVGKKPVGKKSVGKKPVGKKPVGKKSVGKKSVGKKPVGKKSVGKKLVGKKLVGKKPVGKKQTGGFILTTGHGLDLISEGQFCKYCSKLLDPSRRELRSTKKLPDTCCQPCGVKGLDAFKAIKEELYPDITKLSPQQYDFILTEIRDSIRDSNVGQCGICETITKTENGTVISRHKSHVDLRNFFLHRLDQQMYKKVSKEFKISVSNGIDCKVCKKKIESPLFRTNAIPCSYCGYNVHKVGCVGKSEITLYGSSNDERNVTVCAICHDFVAQCKSLDILTNSSVSHNIDIVLRFGSVTENVTDFSDIVLVDASGTFLKDKNPEKAAYSARALYNHLGMAHVKAKSDANDFSKLTMGNIVHTTYDGPAGQNKEVIHAYSYDFLSEEYPSKNKDQCILLLAGIYTKIFEAFIKSNKGTLHLLPLSGGIFAGEHKLHIVSITHNAIQLAFQTIKIRKTRTELSNKTIKLCLYSGTELAEYVKSDVYELEHSPTFTPLEKSKEYTQPKEMILLNLTEKNLQYLRTLSKCQYQILESQVTTNGIPNIVLILYSKVDSANVEKKCIINYTAIMNALSLLKQTHPDIIISDIVSKLVFEVREEELPVYKALFIEEFYLMLPFHLRFQNYESLHLEDNRQLNTTPYATPNKILQSNTTSIIEKLDFRFEINPEGSIGVAKALYDVIKDAKIGLLIAGNSGSPGGMACKLFGSDYTAPYPELELDRPQKLQEESIIYHWLKEETSILGNRFLPQKLLNHSIRGQWGLVDLDEDAKVDDYETLQGIDYTDASPNKYRTAWVYQDCYLDKHNPFIKANLVFVSGPNINAERAPNGSMKRTKNTVLKLSEQTKILNPRELIHKDELTCTFVQGVKEALRAGLYASYMSNCKIVIVPYVSGGIYLSNNKQVLERFKRLIYPVILNEVLNETNPTIKQSYNDAFDEVILCDIGNSTKMMKKRQVSNFNHIGNQRNQYKEGRNHVNEPEPEPEPNN